MCFFSPAFWVIFFSGGQTTNKKQTKNGRKNNNIGFVYQGFVGFLKGFGGFFGWFCCFFVEIGFFSTNQKNAGAPRWAPICRAFGASFTFVRLERDLQWLWLVHPRVSQCWKVGCVILIRGPVQCIEESNIYLCFFCDFGDFWWIFVGGVFCLFVESRWRCFFLWCIFFAKNTHIYLYIYIPTDE